MVSMLLSSRTLTVIIVDYSYRTHILRALGVPATSLKQADSLLNPRDLFRQTFCYSF